MLEYEGIAHVLVAVAGGTLGLTHIEKMKFSLWRYVVMFSRRKVPESFEPSEVAHRRLIRFLLRLKIIDYYKHFDIIKRYKP